ncbi:hypothetical protein BC936DRAFT_142272, partial [Jimgerdemannia flammicorona]
MLLSCIYIYIYCHLLLSTPFVSQSRRTPFIPPVPFLAQFLSSQIHAASDPQPSVSAEKPFRRHLLTIPPRPSPCFTMFLDEQLNVHPTHSPASKQKTKNKKNT